LKFAAIACELQGRTVESVRNRYNNHLDPALNKTRFTEEEKVIIMRVAAQSGEPKNWAAIAKHVPGRSVLQVKNYWHNTTKRNGGVFVKKAKTKKKNARQHGGVPLSGSPDKKAKKQHQEQVEQGDLTNHY
jgi:Myb-like DNA-binding domain